MHLAALPQKKTIKANIRPALVAIGLFVFGIIAIPVSYPVRVYNGSITPEIVRPGENVEVHWLQDWKHLCPVTVTREFVGADQFRKIAAPYEFEPPKEKGLLPYTGEMVVPDLPVGDAYYSSLIQPHCWLDHFWQRSYRTPEIRLTMVKAAPPAGPR